MQANHFIPVTCNTIHHTILLKISCSITRYFHILHNHPLSHPSSYSTRHLLEPPGQPSNFPNYPNNHHSSLSTQLIHLGKSCMNPVSYLSNLFTHLSCLIFFPVISIIIVQATPQISAIKTSPAISTT